MKNAPFVIPAKAGIQHFQYVMDSRLRGNDIFQRSHKVNMIYRLSGQTLFGIDAALCFDPAGARYALEQATTLGQDAVAVSRILSEEAADPQDGPLPDEALLQNGFIARQIAATDGRAWQAALQTLLQSSPEVLQEGPLATCQRQRTKVENILALKMLPGARAYRKIHGRFDLDRLTPAMVHFMTPQEKKALALQYIKEIETLGRKTAEAVRELEPGNMQGFETLLADFRLRAAHWHRLHPQLPETSLAGHFITALFSSGKIVQITLETRMEEALRRLGQTQSLPLFWDLIIREIREMRFEKEYTIAGEVKMHLPITHRELAFTLLDWLRKNFPSQRWNNGVLEFHNTVGPLWDASPLFRPTRWPRRWFDPLFIWYARQLGWDISLRLDQEFDPEHLTITLDFGETLVPPEETAGWIRDAKGNFETALMTQDDTQNLTSREKGELTVQLTEALHTLAAETEAKARALKKRDFDGLQRLITALEEEQLRLFDLFPLFENPELASLVSTAKFSVYQLMEVLKATMKETHRRLVREFADWDEEIGKLRCSQITRTHQLVGTHGYRVDLARNVISQRFTEWLRKFEPLEERWDAANNMWLLTFEPSKVPPLPHHDSPLQASLDILGWAMTLEGQTEGGRTIGIYFGLNAV